LIRTWIVWDHSRPGELRLSRRLRFSGSYSTRRASCPIARELLALGSTYPSHFGRPWPALADSPFCRQSVLWFHVKRDALRSPLSAVARPAPRCPRAVRQPVPWGNDRAGVLRIELVGRSDGSAQCADLMPSGKLSSAATRATRPVMSPTSYAGFASLEHAASALGGVLVAAGRAARVRPLEALVPASFAVRFHVKQSPPDLPRRGR
jgi:hypothetical protein